MTPRSGAFSRGPKSEVDIKNPCGGSVAAKGPKVVIDKSKMKYKYISRLLKRARHRVTDINKLYVSIQHTLVSVCRQRSCSCSC